jgi:Helicase conserved C-terminal domain
MAKSILTPQILAALVAASPEGFFRQSELHKYTNGAEQSAEIIAGAIATGKVGREGEFVYDTARLSAEQVRERSALYSGAFPSLRDDGMPSLRPIAERMKARDSRLRRLNDPVLKRLVQAYDNTPGYLPVGDLCPQPGDEGALMILQDMSLLKRSEDLVFDPLRITRGSLKEIHQQQVITPVRQQLLDLLAAKPGHTAPRVDLVEQFGANVLQQVLDTGGFDIFTVPLPVGESVWVRLADGNADAAQQIAAENVLPKDVDWQPALDRSGETLRVNARDGESRREQVLARSYTLAQAANRTGIRQTTLQSAIAEGRVAAFADPEGVQRIPAAEVESIVDDPVRVADITDLEVIRIRDLAIVVGLSTHAIKQQLRKAGIGAHRGKVRWGQVAGLLDLPDSLSDFRAVYTTRRAEWLSAREEERANERRERDERRERERTRRDDERRQREQLRARLLAAFPTWKHAGRAEQRVLLHIGPPNSGKTHVALDALSIANSGWYLAPLRLLAFEVFDRLNQRGIRCSLLTGEEYIPVPGATVTASTIEMFNPERSGECVVIDEAQMLADPDRGWAWTRALMEAQAPDIHVIGPPNAQTLIERLAGAAAIPVEMIGHERLAPLEVAHDPWPLDRIPERTILVAFSRRMVLHLKTELEMRKRTVSVVYGNLPPEVRRRQADRFAEGQTEICVATDAVGMGLNLPADRVCFFELEKYDGKNMRHLTPAEVHQIGGRAGRYGMSTVGEVGATTRRGLKTLKSLYEIPPEELTHARVAPVVEDLALIPGSLAHRFAQWAELQSIPESLRSVLRPADIDERIALARMLTDAEVEQLGLDAAVRLVNAPTRESSRGYWRQCTLAILAGEPMPLPDEPPTWIDSDADLDLTEQAITCGDIYLWLSHRSEFRAYAPDEEKVREMRTVWSMSIDGALLRRLDTLARCVNCRRPLPLGYRYSLCGTCYANRAGAWY